MDDELKAALAELTSNTAGAVKDAAARYDDLAARLDGIELAGQRPGLGSGQKPIDKAMAAYLRHGFDAIGEDHRANLAVSPDTGGGYLTSGSTLELEILKEISEHSPIRQYANVKAISSGGVTIPKLTGKPTGSWVGEEETRTAADMTYGQASIVVHEAACYVDVSVKLIEDAAFNIEAEVAEEVGQAFGRMESAAFTDGDGFKKPKGFLTESITKVKSGNATALTADAIIDLYHALPSAYARNAIFGMNRQTMGTVRKMKDGSGQYLWQPALSSDQPPTILGRPVVEFADQPNVGAGLLPIVFGDFSGYRILDRVGISLLRDPYTRATNGQVRIHARRRVGGAAVQLDKFRLQEVGV